MELFATQFQHIQQSALRNILSQAPTGAIHLALGEIHYPSSDYLTKKAETILRTIPLRYTENAGCPQAREAIANYYENSISKEHICLTAGAQEALFASLFSIINKGDEILLANPTFLAYKTMIEMLGGKAVFFHLQPNQQFSLDTVSLQNAISPNTKAILLCNPSNPLGSSFSTQEMETIIQIANENQLLIIADEIYRELYFQEREKSVLELCENSIVISGLSKSHALTGWRIGWLAARKIEVVKKITVAHQYICTSAPTLAQKIVSYALSEKGMIYADEIREFLLKNKKITLSVLQDLGFYIHPSSHAPYLFFRTNYDDMEFCKQLSARGLILVPGSIFGSNGRHFIRLNYGVREKKLRQALHILQNFKFNH